MERYYAVVTVSWIAATMTGKMTATETSDRLPVEKLPVDKLPVDKSPWYLHQQPHTPIRTVLVIGAGLAGCAAAHALAQRGVHVTVVDEALQIASAASGNPIGLTFVRLTSHNSAQNRYYLAAYQYALGALRQIFTNAGIAEGEHWRLNGILRVFDDPAEQAEVEAFFTTPGAAQLAHPLDAAALSALAGFAIDRPGLLQPGSGWLNPASLCRALLAHPAINVKLATRVTSIEYQHDAVGADALGEGALGEGWRAATQKPRPEQAEGQAEGQVLLADAVILANSQAASRFSQTNHLTLRTVRGQITRLPPTPNSQNLQHAINYSGYLTPAWQGFHTVGATFHPKRTDTDETAVDHRENIDRLRNALPNFPALPAQESEDFSGRVAFRAGTPDYLPYVGPAPDADAYRHCYQDGLGKGQLKRDYPLGAVHPHLYVTAGHGSRGITSTLLAAEVLCHWILNSPTPVDTDILHALHPARFLIRQFKRRQTY